MARTPNYDFEKRKKELDRKARKDAKRDERARRRDEAAAEESPAGPPVQPPSGSGDTPRE